MRIRVAAVRVRGGACRPEDPGGQSAPESILYRAPLDADHDCPR